MGCFIVPMTEAVVTTVVTQVLKKKEARREDKLSGQEQMEVPVVHVPVTKKLGWLNKMLWGGSALLAFEHVWHGEVTPWFPFLTGAANGKDAAAMLYEMATVGVSMAVLVTVVWLGMVAVSKKWEKQSVSGNEKLSRTE